MTYIGTINLSEKDRKYYNDLLDLVLDCDDENYDENKIDELGARIDDYFGIASVEFENGKSITIDLASGSSNYYDNIVLWDEDGNELYAFDCNYVIDKEMVFEDEEDTYIIKCKNKKGEC